MAPAAFAASLAQLTGLDSDTAKEQLLPHLESLQSQSEVRNYLDSLLAPGPAAQSFIASYLAYRFPSAPAASTTAAAASGTSSWASTPAGSRAPSPFGTTSGARPHGKARNDSPAGGRAPSVPRAAVAGGVQVRVAPAPAPRAQPAGAQGGKGKGKGKGKEEAEPELELSEEAVKELLEIGRELKAFDARAAEKAKRSCFCQARQHPLSPYIPLCPSCALVLCTLNSPALRCPSCLHFPLLSSATTASHIAALQSRREDLIAREKRRAAAAREQDARERAAIRFPTLGMDMDGIRRAEQAQRSYAGHAGGGSGGLAERIERTFEERAAASAREQQLSRARGGAAAQGGAGGRVLRLDGKTGKVKVQTKVVRPAAKGKGSVVAEETTGVIAPDEHDDGLVPFVDEDDDGVRGEPALRSRKGDDLARLSRPSAEDGRVFVNVTLDEADRPIWAAQDEAFINGGGGDDDEEGTFDAGVASSAFVQPARPAVPGAPAPKEETKSKRRRGGQGAGKAAGETSTAA
ncbi:uncharacterized protein RHOBADRAFT_55278 [Rhodotorula graminis WP1]|uniref:TRIP4/RQT4 C2HC5-type zinc finger domain-containing protein n=1 Tax=Rhodotorula graminis (strain WP1) TaxID=578459 RepID=A0A0P9GJ79_RHOGW|nr:uncharacterized protein RHOBADRAFT_55278 [Rhodotorula graminis WP1]KPV73038.1 hypothetical protein RHOBADRAFT_55278 [Rhodotorula graminis WP1]